MNENPNPAPVVEILKGLQVQRAPQHMLISYRWRNGRGGIIQILGEIIFFLVGLAFLLPPIASLISSPNVARGMTLWQWLTTLPFLLVGFVLVYRGLGIFINTSVYEISLQEFKTRNGPLPFLGEKNLTLPRDEIVRVEWKQVGHFSKQDSSSGHRSGYSATYDVFVVTTHGQNKKILSGLNDRDYAFAVQGEISRFLESRN
jgi:hypothetical protein